MTLNGYEKFSGDLNWILPPVKPCAWLHGSCTSAGVGGLLCFSTLEIRASVVVLLSHWPEKRLLDIEFLSVNEQNPSVVCVQIHKPYLSLVNVYPE